jgi:F-type H+-transporting ATPase subunit alpha
VELQVAILWSVQNGFFDAVPVDKVKAFQNRLSEYLTTRKENILSGIREKKAVDDALGGELKAALNDFVASQPTA